MTSSRSHSETTEPTVLRDRLIACAADHNIDLDYADGIWVAHDQTTGEKAAGVTIRSAWAHVWNTDIHDIDAIAPLA